MAHSGLALAIENKPLAMMRYPSQISSIVVDKDDHRTMLDIWAMLAGKGHDRIPSLPRHSGSGCGAFPKFFTKRFEQQAPVRHDIVVSPLKLFMSPSMLLVMESFARVVASHL